MFCSVNHTALKNLTGNIKEVEFALDVFHVACAPVTVLLNLGVLYIAVRYIDLCGRLNQWFVVSMTFADCMYAIVYMSTKLIYHCFNRSMCKMYYICIWSFQLMSVESLLLLNIDKFISLHYPLRYHQIVTNYSVGAQLVACWSLCTGFATLIFAGVAVHFIDNDESECLVHTEEWAYLTMLICFYVVPLVISLLISIYIFCLAQRMSHIEGHQKLQQNLAKRVLFVFSSTVWTALTMLPYRIGYLSMRICKATCPDWTNCPACEPPVLKHLLYALWFLLPLSTVVNPAITVLTQRLYRQHLNWLFGVFSCCTKLCGNDPLSKRSYQLSSSGTGANTKFSTVSEDASMNMIPLIKIGRQTSSDMFEKL